MAMVAATSTKGGGGGGGKKKVSQVVTKLEAIERGLKNEDPVKLPWIKTAKADSIFGVTILLNAAFIGLDLEYAPEGFSWGFWCGESLFLIVFLVELIMRIISEWPAPWRFFANGCRPEWWGIFDFIVTILGCADAWVVTPILALSASDAESPMSSFTVLRVFRLVRLARLIRVLRMFNELVILVQTLGNSIRAVGWMSLLLSMIIYTGSIICVILLGEPHKDNQDINFYFGTLGDALFSHFCVVTLEGWPDIAKAAMQQNPVWALYFVAMITLTNFALVNLMVGVIVERIIHYSMEQETELSAFVAESEQFRITLQTLFDQADIDANGIVTREEIRLLMEDKRTHDIMTAFGINLDIPSATLFTIMDLHHDGATTFEEFFHACMRLCGSKSSFHSIFVQHDICQARHDLCQRLTKIEDHILQATSRQFNGQSGSASALGDGQQGGSSPEECMTDLLERMERFGQVQLQICAEVESLKDQARNLPGGGIISGGPRVVNTTPQEMGPCCVDSLFCRRKETPSVVVEPARDTNLTKLARKELEAEFRKTKK